MSCKVGTGARGPCTVRSYVQGGLGPHQAVPCSGGGGVGPGVPVLHSEVPGPGSGVGAGPEKVPVW